MKKIVYIWNGRIDKNGVLETLKKVIKRDYNPCLNAYESKAEKGGLVDIRC